MNEQDKNFTYEGEPEVPASTGSFYAPPPFDPPAPSAAPTPGEVPPAPVYSAPVTPPAFSGEPIPRFIPDAAPVTKAKPPKTPPVFSWGKVIAVVLCVSLVSGALGGVITGLIMNRPSTDEIEATSDDGKNLSSVNEGDREKPVLKKEEVDTSKLKTLQQVYVDNVEATVGISGTVTTTNILGWESSGTASGSGVIYTSDGYILTNHHVIDGAKNITVHFYDGTTKRAKLVGYDESNDIAVLKVEATGLPTVIIGNSDNMIVGDTVLAIGNPLGEITFALTSGVVSTPPRDVTMSRELTMSLIQTDCAINSGNSGGGMFNLYGELVGITNAKYSTNGITQATVDNIGFAIPITDIIGIIDGIIQDGEYKKPYIGVIVTNVSEEDQNDGKPVGAYISDVEEDLPADKAGMKAGDIVTKFGDTQVRNSSDLRRAIKRCQEGDKVTLTVYRKNKTITVEITIAAETYAALPE